MFVLQRARHRGQVRRPVRFATLVLLVLAAVPLSAVGPVFFDDDEAVSIYRDFDDGLFGRSLYRGVVFSVKLESFARYRSLPVRDIDGLTGYLLNDTVARALEAGEIEDVVRLTNPSNSTVPRYRLDRGGLRVVFSLEKAPKDLFDEVDRTYPENPDVASLVKESYVSGWLLRIHEAENVYRPGVARVDYEDVLVSAALLADSFQPLWGFHDGNALLER